MTRSHVATNFNPSRRNGNGVENNAAVLFNLTPLIIGRFLAGFIALTWSDDKRARVSN